MKLSFIKPGPNHVHTVVSMTHQELADIVRAAAQAKFGDAIPPHGVMVLNYTNEFHNGELISLTLRHEGE
jgi:hypothetical protein